MNFDRTDKGIFGFGGFSLDATRRRLARDGEPIKLPAKQFDMLLYFLQNPKRVIEKINSLPLSGLDVSLRKAALPKRFSSFAVVFNPTRAKATSSPLQAAAIAG